MKIAFLRKTYTPYGGAERYLSQLIERLCHAGHEVHIYAHRWQDGNFEGRIGNKGLVFHHVPVIPNPSFLEALSFAVFSRRLLERANFDIIHSFERTLYQDIYRAGDGCHREWLIRRRRMDPWVKKFFQPINPLHRTLLFLEKRLFLSPRLKRIIANSQRGKREIIHHYGVPEEKIEVIYNGVDLEVFHPRNVGLFRQPLRRELGIPEESLVILFLGSGFRRKGLEVLIRAFARIKERIPLATLLVAGKDRIGGYREKVRKLGIAKGVFFLGPTERAREFYAASDLFALPTFYDPFSNACLEAMATGIPVLTTPANGVAELIEEGRNGFLAMEPWNVGEVEEKMMSFYRLADRAAFAQRVREGIAHLGIDSAVDRVLKLYEEIRERKEN